MGKTRIFWLILCLSLLLCACEEPQTVFTVEKNGVTYTADVETHTLSDGRYTYNYYTVGVTDVNGNHSETVNIIYPGNESWAVKWDFSGKQTVEKYSWIDGYHDEKYPDGRILAEIVRDLPEPKPEPDWVRAVLGGVLVLFGVLQFRFPTALTRWRYALYVRDPEPTEFAQVMGRIAGVILAVAGIVWIIMGLMGGRT